MLSYLPQRLQNSLNYIRASELQEIRLRTQLPVAVITDKGYQYLSERGTTKTVSSAMIIQQNEMEHIIFCAAECSIYAINEQLKQGYLSLPSGIRMGVCGEIVLQDGVISTVKNITSLCIRLPHSVTKCAEQLLELIVMNERKTIHNTLIIAPPGAGKTTYLRDLSAQITHRFFGCNVLILDERGELCAPHNGNLTIDAGDSIDVIYGGNKAENVVRGIRAMRPNVIITDELANESDLNAVYFAHTCGVKIIASVHGDSLSNVQNKEWRHINCFTRFAVLSMQPRVGTLSAVYDQNFEKIYHSGGDACVL